MARPHPTRWFFSAALLAVLAGCAGAQPVGPTVESLLRKQATLPPAAPLATAPTAAVPTPTAPPRDPAPPPKLWPVTSWRGADYVDVRDLAKRFELKAEWTKSATAVSLSDKSGVRFTFEEKQRDFYFDGLRIFLGEAAIQEKESLWISKLDVLKTLAPLFRPEEHAASLPPGSPRTIVLDPGHGGSDPGKENKTLGVNEKTFTLDVALRLKKLLELQGWRVLLTRTEDVKLAPEQALDLQRRADFANQQKADLFVSIHFNAVERDPQRVTGVETYTLAPRSMLSTSAERKDEMTDVSFPGNQLDSANLLLGETLHRSMIGQLKASDRGYKRARFSVLRFVQCPGALVECAYLSNDAEARRAANPEYRQHIALALAAGVQKYAATLAALRPKPVAPPDAPAGPPATKAQP